MENRKDGLLYQLRAMEEELWNLTDAAMANYNEFMLAITALVLLRSAVETSNKTEEKQLEQLDFKITDLQILLEELKSDSRNSQMLTNFYTQTESMLSFLMVEDDNIIKLHIESLLELTRLQEKVKQDKSNKYTNCKIGYQKL